ncbi:acyl-[ACP]--phospholipid O-acyltransferase [Rickettsiales endosymbiont of Peranema trichophorum]|uniref:acyl-[ACP]--phospholipid O-acyltransferase n=1 Tax=Rickettsiales endosymbiont of Peranema trichophorum TaxID=2486577 RepID=UPI00241466DD|nr:acyl-[ACP]--phospholipid O-acyltransferase [Rickettsiales endosymbiont of Peranema trichophorum]
MKLSQLLTTRRFLPLFVCQFVATFGDNFIRTAFITLIGFYSPELSSLKRSILIHLTMALFIVPFCLFSATGGKLADKFCKGIFVQWLKVSNIVVCGIVVVGFMTNNHILLLLSIFLIGIEAALFGAAKYSILPESLTKDELIFGNGLIEAGTFIAIPLGIIFGGVLVSDTSVTLVSVLTIAMGLIGYISSLFIVDSKICAPKTEIRWNIVKETLDCVETLRTNHRAFLSVLGISWFWLIGGLFISQVQGLTKEVFSGDQSVFILLLSLFSIGMGVGSVLCDRLLHSQVSEKYVPASMMILSCFFLDLWWVSTLTLKREYLGGIHYFLSTSEGVRACIDIFFISVCSGIYVVPLYAILQTSMDIARRSQAIAANNIVSSGFMVVASLISMCLVTIGLSASQLLFVLAVANFFTATYICRILPDKMVKSLLEIVLKLIYRVEVIGLENYHKAGKRILVIANHASFLDPLLIGILLPGRFTFAIDTYIARKWWLRPFLTFLRAYPVDPTNPMAAKTLIDQLKAERPVVIFPEGRITVTGSLMKVYEGPGLIADKANATLLPIRIDGTQYSLFSKMHGKLKLKLFPKIVIHIQEPQKLRVPAHLTNRERRHAVGNMLYDIMSEMMFAGSKNTVTLFESLTEAYKQFGRRTVIIHDANKNSMSYYKLMVGAFLLGDRIAKSTEHRERIGIMLPNVVATVSLFFGVLVRDRIPAMLNFSTGTSNILASCTVGKITKIYTSRVFVEKGGLENVVNSIEKSGIELIYLEDIRSSISLIEKCSAMWKAIFPTRYYHKYYDDKKMERPSPDEQALLAFTSGSEGRPKGVVLSHSNILSNLKQLASRIDFTSSDKLFNALPIFHAFGLTGGMILPIFSGVKTYLYHSPLHYRIIPELIYGINATCFFATDTFLANYAKYALPYDFFSIRYVFAGAEKLKPETTKMWMEKFGIRILEGYGTTETSPAIALNTGMHSKIGTVGRILPGMKYIVEPIEGIKEGGKLIVSGPNVMLGYIRYDNPNVIEKPKYKIGSKMVSGWYDTGDIVDVDAEGYITIVGRIKRFAKVGGEMIPLSVIEEMVSKLWPESRNAAVVVNDPKKGESIILFTTHTAATKEDITQYLIQSGYSELFVPKSLHHIQELPMLSTGKTDYPALLEILSPLENS